MKNDTTNYQLSDLDKLETRLLNMVSLLTGTMEENQISLQNMNLPIEYSLLHSSYVRLATVSQNLEALKRAIFIQWYTITEPVFLTGIGALEQSFQLSALKELHARHILQTLDEEFYWMLKCYYSISNIFITQQSGFEELAKYIEYMSKWDPTLASKFSFTDRGCMGKYWISRS